MSHILIVDDDNAVRRSFTSIMGKMRLKSIATGEGKEALEILSTKKISLVFLDLRLPDMDGMTVLKEIRDLDASILVIMITGYATIESAIEAIGLGAYDYIKKPFKSDTIKVITKLALEKLRLSREIESLHLEKASHSASDEMIGTCDEMVAIGKQIAKVTTTDVNILLQGESGTGKELIANMIHKKSNRASQPLIHLNCSAFPKSLLESEFFGYEKGAFTGADHKKKGLIEQADSGTLHLDEISEMDLSLQAKLLRVLEGRTFRRIGGEKEISANIRIIASTNKDLSEETHEGRFREDLYYRLSAFPITIPPLRERGEDIINLAMYYLKLNNVRFNKNIQVISEEAEKILLSYHWPGNVRELKNIMERTMILIPGDTRTLLPAHLPLNYPYVDNLASGRNLFSASFDSMVQFKDEIDFEQVTVNITNQIKKRIIGRALELTRGNKTKASQILHISRSALWREMEKLKRWREQNRSSFEL